MHSLQNAFLTVVKIYNLRLDKAINHSSGDLPFRKTKDLPFLNFRVNPGHWKTSEILTDTDFQKAFCEHKHMLQKVMKREGIL